MSDGEALYLYAVLEGDPPPPAVAGLEGQPLLVVSFGGLSVVAHSCPPRPYVDQVEQVVTAWVQEHHRVVESYWQAGLPLLPFTFNTIIQGRTGEAAVQVLQRWLEENGAYLRGKLQQLAGGQEYGVQLIMDRRQAAERLAATNAEIQAIKQEVAGAPRGKAFLLREKMAGAIKNLLEREADQLHQEVWSGLRRLARLARQEKCKKLSGDRVMILHASCLVTPQQSEELGNFLSRYAQRPDLAVVLSGPWPPYSFA